MVRHNPPPKGNRQFDQRSSRAGSNPKSRGGETEGRSKKPGADDGWATDCAAPTLPRSSEKKIQGGEREPTLAGLLCELHGTRIPLRAGRKEKSLKARGD